MNLNQFPYSDFHEMNLDWLLCEVNKLKQSMHDFKIANALHIEGPWSINKAYQAYSIVTDNNLGYIARKAVPAGISVTNTEYWQNIADFTALYADLGDRVSDLETITTAINSELTGVIKEDWSKRSVLFVGDSYLDGWNGSTSVTTYADYINNNIRFGHYYKASRGGSGFSTGLTYHYLTRLQEWVNAQNVFTLNSITDIYIMGGYNDIGGTESDIINGSYGINAIKAYISNKMPNAKITIGFLGRAMYDTTRTFNQIQATIKTYRKGAIQAGISYLEGSELCMHDYTSFSSDKIHPTATGYSRLGDYLTDLILNRDFDYMYTDAAVPGLNVDFTGSSFSQMPCVIYQGLTRNACTLDSYGGQYSFTTPINSWNASYETEIKIGNFLTAATPNYFRPKYEVHMNVPVTIQHSAGIDNVNGYIGFKSNGDIVISILSLDSSTWSYKTFTNVSKILIGKGTINIPIEYC